uniref:Uncharacterized protein n=1 Tax=Anguilla anguilla TaxID=7936 RepID=A0A0E9U6Y9_ANGAN
MLLRLIKSLGEPNLIFVHSTYLHTVSLIPSGKNNTKCETLFGILCSWFRFLI